MVSAQLESFCLIIRIVEYMVAVFLGVKSCSGLVFARSSYDRVVLLIRW